MTYVSLSSSSFFFFFFLIFGSEYRKQPGDQGRSSSLEAAGLKVLCSRRAPPGGISEDDRQEVKRVSASRGCGRPSLPPLALIPALSDLVFT